MGRKRERKEKRERCQGNGWRQKRRRKEVKEIRYGERGEGF